VVRTIRKSCVHYGGVSICSAEARSSLFVSRSFICSTQGPRPTTVDPSVRKSGKVDASRYNDVLMPVSCFSNEKKKNGNEVRQPTGETPDSQSRENKAASCTAFASRCENKHLAK